MLIMIISGKTKFTKQLKSKDMDADRAQEFRIESMARSVFAVRPWVKQVYQWYKEKRITSNEMENCLKWHMGH